MAKKNGKTALIAALALVHLVGPEAIPQAEIYSGANSRKQASLVFEAAWSMVKLDASAPEPLGLSDLVIAIPSKKRLVCHAFGSFYQSLSADGDIEEGISPTVWIVDELGRTKNTSLYESLSNATGAWEEPLGFVISVQARSPHMIMSELVRRGRDILKRRAEIGDTEGREIEPQWAVAIWEVPEDADPFDESFWPLANPALGDFKSLATMRDAAEEARKMPSRLPSFKNLQLNQQVDDLVQQIHTREDWIACADAVDEAALEGETCVGGLDLSRRIDLSALALVFKPTPQRPKKSVVMRCWTPDFGLEDRAERDRAPYQQWRDEGHLIVTEGKAINYRYVAQEIAKARARFNFETLAFDPWGIDKLCEALDEEGVAYWIEGDDDPDDAALKLVKFGQGYKSMSPAIEAMEIDVMEHRLAHGGHPVLQWAASNAVTMSDPAGNRKLAKHRARNRIDPYVALTMANGIASLPDDEESSELQQGLIVI